MTIIEADAWTGLPVNAVRPFTARVRMGEQLETVAKDQAFGFRSLTGNSVPNAPDVDVATPHVHDGTNGLVIPIPYIQCYLGATLHPAAFGGPDPEWAKLHWPIFFVQPGVTIVRVYVFTTTPVFLQNQIRVTSFDSSLAPYSAGGAFFHDQSLSFGDIACLRADVVVQPNAINAVLLEAVDGYMEIPPRSVLSYSIVPLVGAPHPVPAYLEPLAHSDEVLVPSGSHHLGSDPFTSFDSAMFDDDRAVSSYLAYSMVMNEAYCFEKATGLPAGTRQTATHDGHHHHSGEDDSGAEMVHSLGAWSYGVGRRGPSGSAEHLAVDEVSTEWSGRIHAPTIVTSTSAVVVARHHVRLPGAASASWNGAGSKLNVAALVYNDNGKTSGLEFGARMYDTAVSAAGTRKSDSTTTTGWQIIQLAAVDRNGAGGDDDIQVLQVDLTQSAGATQGGAVYSVCAWFEP